MPSRQRSFARLAPPLRTTTTTTTTTVRLAVLTVVGFAALGGTMSCRPKKQPAPSATSSSSSGAMAQEPQTPASVTAKNAAPVCAALDVAKLAPFATCGTNVVKTPVPEIVDATNNLAPFYNRLAELERGTATRPVRIGIYGDSNLTSDFLSGHLRRVLQARYGDAGHGYISLARMWGSYRHEDVVQAGYWPQFKQWAPTTHVCPDKQYGFANMAAESNDPGAAAWAATTKDPKSKVGQNVSHFELHFLKQPHGGSFAVQIDKKEVRTIETKASAFEAGIEMFDVDDGPHEIKCAVRGDGKVRLFGVSFDRATGDRERAGESGSGDADAGASASADAGLTTTTTTTSTAATKPGIQVDSLGAGALNYQRLTWVANDTRRVQLAKRNYDIIILWLGTNVMFVPPNKEYAKEFIGELRTALPSVPVLVLSPGDTAHDGETKSDPRIVQVVKQMREVAAETGSAFWDFREAMGGEGSIIGFTKRGLTGEDHIHFGPEGSHLMGDRLLCAVTTSFTTHVGEHHDAGCPSSSPSTLPRPTVAAASAASTDGGAVINAAP